MLLLHDLFVVKALLIEAGKLLIIQSLAVEAHAVVILAAVSVRERSFAGDKNTPASERLCLPAYFLLALFVAEVLAFHCVDFLRNRLLCILLTILVDMVSVFDHL